MPSLPATRERARTRSTAALSCREVGCIARLSTEPAISLELVDRLRGAGPQNLLERLRITLDLLPLVETVDDPARVLVVAAAVGDVVAELLAGEAPTDH